jgi:hypothetical protein
MGTRRASEERAPAIICCFGQEPVAMSEWFSRAVCEAVTSTLGWTGVILLTLVAGFWAGYAIGHREFTDLAQTLTALTYVPFLWLGFSQVFFAYGVTALAWYLPLRYDSRWLRIVAAVANLLTWLVVVVSVVRQSANAKFFRY